MDANDRINMETHILRTPLFEQLKTELTRGLRLYWDTAGKILQGSGIRLSDADPAYFSLEKNLFSSLFLYSYARGGITSSRRTLYAALNQCLRGMVTGCDNLLDDEYKPTLVTDLPEKGTRFRSVLDIMVSDRVLFELLVNQGEWKQISCDQVLAASRASLHCLARSGAQEASEEKGAGEIPAPDDLLRTVHHFKTGILFQAPWAAVEVLENIPQAQSTPLKEALYRIGMGCQILDDMVDFEKDLRDRRHNFVASLIFHGAGPHKRLQLEQNANTGGMLAFPKAQRKAALTATSYLHSGLQGLFAEEHAAAVPFFLQRIVRRIGAEGYMPDDGLGSL